MGGSGVGRVWKEGMGNVWEREVVFFTKYWSLFEFKMIQQMEDSRVALLTAVRQPHKLMRRGNAE